MNASGMCVYVCVMREISNLLIFFWKISCTRAIDYGALSHLTHFYAHHTRCQVTINASLYFGTLYFSLLTTLP